jgi:tetratricopeptide (TPR) repeat protein
METAFFIFFGLIGIYFIGKQIEKTLVDNKLKKVDKYNEMISQYLNENNYDKAIQLYTKIIKLESDSILHFVERAKIYERNKNYELAIADYKHAILLMQEQQTNYSPEFYMSKFTEYTNAMVALELLKGKTRFGLLDNEENNKSIKQNEDKFNYLVNLMNTNGHTIPVDRNQVEKYMKYITNLFNIHTDKIYSNYINDSKITNYIRHIKEVINSVIIPSVSIKLTDLIKDNNKKTFSCNEDTPNETTVFYIELYPKSKNEVKASIFKNSYRAEFEYLLNYFSNKLKSNNYHFKMQNVSFFHIMLFFDGTNYEIDMGIASFKYGFFLEPYDLLSETDLQPKEDLETKRWWTCRKCGCKNSYQDNICTLCKTDRNY